MQDSSVSVYPDNRKSTEFPPPFRRITPEVARDAFAATGATPDFQNRCTASHDSPDRLESASPLYAVGVHLGLALPGLASVPQVAAYRTIAAKLGCPTDYVWGFHAGWMGFSVPVPKDRDAYHQGWRDASECHADLTSKKPSA